MSTGLAAPPGPGLKSTRGHFAKDDVDLLRDVERFIKRPILDETDHEYRESFLNMVRNFKTSRRKEAQKRNKTKKTEALGTEEKAAFDQGAFRRQGASWRCQRLAKRGFLPSFSPWESRRIITCTPSLPPCGGEPTEYAARAASLGLTEIGFTEHAPMPDDDFDDWRMPESELDLYQKLDQAERDNPNVTIRRMEMTTSPVTKNGSKA